MSETILHGNNQQYPAKSLVTLSQATLALAILNRKTITFVKQKKAILLDTHAKFEHKNRVTVLIISDETLEDLLFWIKGQIQLGNQSRHGHICEISQGNLSIAKKLNIVNM